MFVPWSVGVRRIPAEPTPAPTAAPTGVPKGLAAYSVSACARVGVEGVFIVCVFTCGGCGGCGGWPSIRVIAG